MKNILITGVGGPTPRSFVRSVNLADKKKTNSFRFVGADCNPLAYGLYDQKLFAKSYLVPRATDKEYWSVINKIIEDEKIDGAIILPEEEVLEWAKNKDKQTSST